jgi:dTDP-4-amino-4,6-dideoxygalactose transaminase
MKVPYLDLRLQFKQIENDVRSAIEQLFQSQHFIMGETVRKFEENIASYCNVPHAIGCGSGTDALVLGLRALGVGPGDEVITSPFSFFSTASSIVLAGAKPVFADIAPDTFNLDCSMLEDSITEKTAAALPVHLFGQCADMNAIAATAARHGIPVLEDAAQAIGARFDGRPAGSMGDIGIFSFYPTKNLGGYGEAGLLTTAGDELAGKLRFARMHGETDKNVHTMLGINSRLDAIQAAVLDVKLSRLEQWTEARRSNAAAYNELFAAKKLAPEHIQTPYMIESENSRHRHVFNLYTIRARKRDALSEHLRSRGIGHIIAYPMPLYLQPCFSHLGYEEDLCPQAELAAKEVISLPIFPELTQEQIETVVGAIEEFYL